MKVNVLNKNTGVTLVWIDTFEGETGLIFSKDGHEVTKRIRHSREMSMPDVVTRIMSFFKEAERDIAYQQYGDDWRNHVEWDDFTGGKSFHG